MLAKGLRTVFSLRFDPPGGRGEAFRRVLPFRRSWPAIVILALLDAAFMLPAIMTFREAVAEWGRFDSLFDLVGALFLSAWLLGWSIAPVLMTAILVMMLCGREVLSAGPGWVGISIGIPFIGVRARYDVAKMRNLRFERPLKKSGKAWRGAHLLFDYGADTVAVGSAISGDEVSLIRAQLEAATGAGIRRGEAADGEAEPPRQPVASAAAQAPGAAPARHEPVSLGSPSTLLLVAANLVPLAGSALLGWNLADVMLLYWAESAIIGCFNLCKIIVIGRWAALLAGPFFVGHFGAFMAVHFLFLYTIFIQPAQAGAGPGGDLAEVAQLFVALLPALAALFASHAFSFYFNFMGRQEYRGRTVKAQMSEPYNRIIFMHLVLIFGGGLSLVLGGPAPVLLLVIVLKIYFDIRAHLKQHPGSGEPPKA